MLQERNAAQPDMDQQPLEPANSSVPATEWVSDLRDVMPTFRRPDLSEFEALFADTVEDDVGMIPNDLSGHDPDFQFPQDVVEFMPETAASLSLENFEPSADFQEAADLLQSTNFEPESAMDEETLGPPPLPETPVCDWYLPPPELGTALLSEFLVDFNTAYPLYRPSVIAEHLRICYAGMSDGSAVSWTSAYIIFGLAHMLRGMSATATKQDNELAKYYLSRTYTSLTSLLLSPPSLGLIQCLIGTAWLIRTTPCGRNVPDGHFLSTSLRVAQSLAYHDDETEAVDPDRDIQQERRVFWLAFINDTNASMVSNAPTTHRREDIVAPKPEENPSDSLGAVVSAEGHWKVNVFRLRVELALIQAEAIEQVFSIKARNTAPQDLDAAAALVLARLQGFHEHEIFKLSPAQLFQLLYRSDITHTVTLEASHFATVFRLTAFLALDKNPRINPFRLDGLRRLSTIKVQRSYGAAKRLLSLLPIAPRGDTGLYWMEHQVFIAALVVVLSHHLNNPEQPKASKDELRVYNELVTDLRVLDKRAADENTHIAQSRELCMSLLIRLETGLRIQWLQEHAEQSGELTPPLPDN